MDQRGFAEAFPLPGFGRDARLERIAGLLDWAPIEALVRQGRRIVRRNGRWRR
ncbi:MULTISPECIES: hypothetical protein [unclassified Sphingomonas]|uniref:hypothetical protein n=1 Tax=unclassified Sphingomonas TaxID=196159 RepID=UPI0016073506|nr:MULTISPECIES: hypothetical protein [unclassified Sphingomonas]MBB3348170.1 hypothetical protein [Sphingomonas sp. BK069]MBB3473749.1 hypothetical protein [Sphingomonas sp. BK345]